jgi:hypothetical protein
MDVVLECKDERAEGTCDTEATPLDKILVPQASNILLIRFNSRGLHCTVELFSRSLRQLRTFTRFTVICISEWMRKKWGCARKKVGDGRHIHEKTGMAY